MRFLYTIIAIILSVVCIQFVLSSAYLPWVPKEIRTMRKVLQSKPDMLYLGDSVLDNIADSDTDKRTIPEMLQGDLTNFHIGSVAHPAYDTDIYVAFSSIILQSPQRPKIVIFPINLRSFSPTWDKRPGFEFGVLKRSLQYYNTPIFPFVNILVAMNVLPLESNTKENFFSTPVYDGNTFVAYAGTYEIMNHDMSKADMQGMITYFYQYPLSTSQRKIQSIIKILNSYRPSIQVILYITPIDYQTGERYLGDRFIQRLHEHVGLIKQIAEEHNASVIDLSMSLSSDAFNWKPDHVIDEHLNQRGRVFIADTLASTVSALLKIR